MGYTYKHIDTDIPNSWKSKNIVIGEITNLFTKCRYLCDEKKFLNNDYKLLFAVNKTKSVAGIINCIISEHNEIIPIWMPPPSGWGYMAVTNINQYFDEEQKYSKPVRFVKVPGEEITRNAYIRVLESQHVPEVPVMGKFFKNELAIFDNYEEAKKYCDTLKSELTLERNKKLLESYKQKLKSEEPLEVAVQIAIDEATSKWHKKHNNLIKSIESLSNKINSSNKQNHEKELSETL